MKHIPSTRSCHVIPAPKTPWDPDGGRPVIDPSSYVSPQAVVIGKVLIGREVFVAPFASIRGDEGGPILIGDGSNVQDGAILHALLDSTVEIAGGRWAIYIGRMVSLTHGCIIHGPAAIGDSSFVGFGAIVFRAQVGRNAVLLHRAIVTGDVTIPDGRLVPAGTIVDRQDQADSLPPVTEAYRALQTGIIRVNRELVRAYRETALGHTSERGEGR